MNRPDLLICWIKHADYPIFRETLRKHRDFFGKIIIYWSEHFREDYFDKFIQKDLESLGNIQFLPNIEYKYGEEDWRNIATNHMLQFTDSEWVCSVEQDWFSKDWGSLLEMVNEAMQSHDLVGWGAKSGAKQFYIHPAFWFIKRSLLDKTRKDFSAKDGEDHFGLITRDAEVLVDPEKVFCIERDGGLKCDVGTTADAFHLGGVNQNYINGLTEGYVFHRPEAFMIYNYWCRKSEVTQDARFTELSLSIEGVLRQLYPDLDLENNDWVKYFDVRL